jgi:hypothetical protein
VLNLLDHLGHQEEAEEGLLRTGQYH